MIRGSGSLALLVAAALLAGCIPGPPAPTQRTVPAAAPAPAPDGILAFWRWWAQARGRFEGVMGEKKPIGEDLQQELDARVKAIHPGLAWEIGGAPGAFTLTLSPEGNFLLRKLTATWAAQAPRDAGWTFLGARGAVVGATELVMEYGGHEVAIDGFRFGYTVDPERSLIHVDAYHPAFATMDEDTRNGALFLVLDTLLGEDAVEKWIGGIEPVLQAPAGSVAPAELVAEVVEVSRASEDSDYELSTLQLRGDDGQPLLAVLDLRLKRLDHLHHDWHLEVVYPFTERSESGHPTDEAYARAAEAERELVLAIGADVVFYGHVLHGGVLRVLFYVEERDRVAPALEAWVKAHAAEGVTAVWTRDPEWKRHAAY